MPVLIYANGVSVDDVARRVLQEYATVAARLEAKHGRKIERFMQGKMYAEAESEILCGIEDLEASSVDGTYLMIGLLGDLLKVRVALGQHHFLEETMSRREALAVDFGGPESRELLGVLADHWDIYEEMGRIDEMEALRKRRKAILKNRRWHRVREFLNLLFGLGR